MEFFLKYWKFTPAVVLVGMAFYALFRVWLNERRERQAEERRAKKAQHDLEHIRSAVTKHAPLFYDNTRGNRKVLVTRASRDQCLPDAKPWGTVLVHPALTFTQSSEVMVYGDVGTWSYLHEIKMEALRVISGLTPEEFREVILRHQIYFELDALTVHDPRLFVPYTSQGTMRFETQMKLFGEWSAASAKEFILSNIPNQFKVR